MAGVIAGGFVGTATGDPSALVVIGGGVLLGAASGAAGGFTSSVVSQGIDQGQIDWGQVAVDTGTGAVIGGVTGGVGGGAKVLLRPRPGVAPRGTGTTPPARAGQGPRIHSRYADGTPVFEGQQPPRITGPEAAAQGKPHTVLRWDPVNGRIYQAREFGPDNTPIRDIDFTNPTFPNGTVRPGHPGPPHQHRWIPNNPNNPRAGFRRGGPEDLQ